jgi:hypothetical protein
MRRNWSRRRNKQEKITKRNTRIKIKKGRLKGRKGRMIRKGIKKIHECLLVLYCYSNKTYSNVRVFIELVLLMTAPNFSFLAVVFRLKIFITTVFLY